MCMCVFIPHQHKLSLLHLQKDPQNQCSVICFGNYFETHLRPTLGKQSNDHTRAVTDLVAAINMLRQLAEK